ncbi:MAG: DUF983 domain-containing protein [Ardenticatenales bacterium]|nr:DUF983 domain-containing protein [Ardenticatenales bacterium]
MRTVLELFWDTGIRLKCPVCEQGKLFKNWFTMNTLCPHCYVRFERHEGEVTGGMTISILVTAFLFLVGYSASEMFFEWPTWVHLLLWSAYALIFPIAFYRYSRALWVVVLHLGGQVHWDKEPYQETQLSIIDAFLNKSPDDPSGGASLPPSPPPSRSSDEERRAEDEGL